MEKETYYVVDKDGEVISELYGDTTNIRELGGNSRLIVANEGDRLLKRNSLVAYNKKKSKTGGVKIDFAKVNRRYIGRITMLYPLIMVLVGYINYEDNVLSYSNGKIVTPTNLSRVTGISISTCKRQFRGLVELGIIKRVRLDRKYVYAFDPYVANCSKDISLETLELFKASGYREDE